MKNTTYNVMRLLAGILTVVIVVAQYYIPERRISIIPNADYPQAIYSPGNARPEHQTKWINANEHHWQCTYMQDHEFSCGYSVSISTDNVRGINLEEYDNLTVKIKYRGEAPRLRIYMRNYNPNFDRGDPLQSAKFISTTIRVVDLKRETSVNLSEFGVAEWWINKFDIPREYAAPEFSNIISMGFDFVNTGNHEVKIEQLDFSGSWFKRESLYLTIIVCWMILVIWEGLRRFYIVYRNSRLAEQKISKLETDYDLLEMEKCEYEALSSTDALTGVLNRAGLHKVIDKVFQKNQDKADLGILLFDIDHFKKINDNHGHDCGDLILKELAKLITQNIRQQEAFGRWGGEEFVLFCAQVKEEQLKSLAEKLCRLVATYQFSPADAQHITVSIGATLITPNDTFAGALKRADLALYDAKLRGRNRVVFKTN